MLLIFLTGGCGCDKTAACPCGPNCRCASCSCKAGGKCYICVMKFSFRVDWYIVLDQKNIWFIQTLNLYAPGILSVCPNANIKQDVRIVLHHMWVIIHHNDVTMGIMTSMAFGMFTQSCIEPNVKKYHSGVTGPLWGESIGDRWIPLAKGQ